MSTDDFRDLYEKTSRRVYAYLRRHADADTAETILSEVYLKAWRHRERLDHEPLPWLLVAARTSLQDHWRSQGRRQRMVDDVMALSRDEVAPGADVIAVDRAQLGRALAQLSETDREALLLVGWDGLSHTEGAQVAGCSTAAFTARVNRARHRLTDLLDPAAEPVRPHLTGVPR